MDRRKPGQSQLDYLWVNFGKLSELRLEDGILVGYDDDGKRTIEIPINVSSSNGVRVTGFGQKETESGFVYYIKLSDGTEFTAPIDAPNLNDLKLEVSSNTELLQIITGDGEGSLSEMLRLAKEYTDSKLDLELKAQVDANTQTLQILTGSGEGSIVDIVTTQINDALNWQEI